MMFINENLDNKLTFSLVKLDQLKLPLAFWKTKGWDWKKAEEQASTHNTILSN